MKIYFVWVKSLHGTPEAQVWFGKQVDGNGKAKPTLAIHEIHQTESTLGIVRLSERYPYEQPQT